MSNGAVDVIDLISSDDEGPPNVVPIPTFPSAPQTPVPKRPRAPSRPPSIPAPGPIDDDDDEVEFVSHVTKKSRSANTAPNANNAGKPEAVADNIVPLTSGDEDADLIVVSKKTGLQANIDYPHNRFSCGVYPFGSSDKRQYCEKCYCYVCDDAVPKCLQWNYHSGASDKVVKWRSERAKAARARNARLQSNTTFKKRTSRDFFTPRSGNRWNTNPIRRSPPRRSPLAINARDIIPPASFATSMPSIVTFQDNVLAILNNNRHQIDASALSQTQAHGILPPITTSAANALEALDSALSLPWPRPEPPRLVSSALLHTPAVPRPPPRSAPAQASRINNVAIPPLSAPPTNGLPRPPPFETDRNSSDGFSYDEVRRMLNATPIPGSGVPRMPTSNNGGSRTSRTWTVPQDVDNSPTKLPPLVSPTAPVQNVLPPAPPPAPVSNNISLPPLVDAELPLPPRKRNITVTTSSTIVGAKQQKTIPDTSKDASGQETQNSDISKSNFSISSLVQPQNTNGTTGTTTASAQIDDGPAVPPQAGTEFGEDGLANHLLSPFMPNFGDTNFNIDSAVAEVTLFPAGQANVAATNDTVQPMQGVSQPEQGQAVNMRRREPISPGSSSQSGTSSPAAAERIRMRAQDALMDPLKGLMNMGLESGPITMGDLDNVLNKDGEQ